MSPEERKAYKKAWAAANPEKVAESRKAWKERNPGRDKAYYEANKESISKQAKTYRESNKEAIQTKKKAYREAHRKELCEKSVEYQREHKEDRRLYFEKRRTDPSFRLAENLRSRLGLAIKHNFKTGSAIQDLGCSIEYLKAYLEGQFLPGMSWDNWGRDGWHIDHIKPLASFNLTDREQLLQAVHYTNLQPLWAGDNIRKGASI